MGRLSGFSTREIVKKRRRHGFVFDRQAAGSHEIWFSQKNEALLLRGKVNHQPLGEGLQRPMRLFVGGPPQRLPSSGGAMSPIMEGKVCNRARLEPVGSS